MTDRDSSLKHILRHWPDFQISASRFHAPICQIPEIPRDSDIPMRERGRVFFFLGGGWGLKSAAYKFFKISCFDMVCVLNSILLFACTILCI